nr:hypothetical protein BaRGS_025841 [Batillaria attramentaria]
MLLQIVLLITLIAANLNNTAHDCPESDLRTTYLKYPRSSIHPHEIDSDTGRTEQGCLDWCSAESWCRTCKFYSGTGTCYRFQITALDVAASEWIYVNDPSNIYQKSCA